MNFLLEIYPTTSSTSSFRAHYTVAFAAQTMSNNRIPKGDFPMTDAEEGGHKDIKQETISNNNTAIQSTEGTNDNESAHQSQEATTTGTQPNQQINNSDEDDEVGYVDSDKEVKEVMKGMKKWTKTPPFPHDAEYFFPKEPNTKRRIAKRALRLRGMVAQALGKGDKEAMKEKDGQQKSDLGNGDVVGNDKDGK